MCNLVLEIVGKGGRGCKLFFSRPLFANLECFFFVTNNHEISIPMISR